MQHLVSWKVGGEQGQGVESTGEILCSLANRLGYYVYAYREFSSRIKGGHSNVKVRISTRPVASTSADLHVLVAIDQESIDKNWRELVPGGLVVADAAFEPRLPADCPARLLAVPMTQFANEIGNPLVRNVIALGVTAYLFGLDVETLRAVVAETFGRKGGQVREQNDAAVRRGFAFAVEHVTERPWLLAPGDGKARLLLTGNEAIALGALAAGCRFMSAYPITPASEIMEWLAARLPKYGGVVLQTEDEIAAITAAIGAGFAGARAMTATSGPGLSLMQEAIGLAEMAEIPVVIVDAQRGGPSTGMPTKHEQSDVLAVLYGTHGDTPRIVLAPSDPEEAFYDTMLAFNLADRFQCPVFILSDLSLALNKQTVEALDHKRVPIDRGDIVSTEELQAMGPNKFERYALTPSGISPRSLPGQPYGQFLASGLEHDRTGKVSENPKNRVEQMDKRLRKVLGVQVPGLKYAGPEGELDVLLVGFGSSWGAIEVARERLTEQGLRCGHAHLRVLAPFPAMELAAVMARAARVLVVENNATGQLAKLIKVHVVAEHFVPQLAEAGAAGRSKGWARIESVLKYDGRPFLPEEIVQRVAEVHAHAHVG